MVKCPKCNEKTISNFSKLNLGPVRTIECSKCHAKLSVPWSSLIYSFAILMVMNASIIYFKLGLKHAFLLIAVIMPVYFFIHLKLVRLVIRE